MNGKRRLPLGFLAAGLLMALAAVGIVNGLWSKNLVINGEVTTGDLEVEWSRVGVCLEFWTWPDEPEAFPDDFGEFLGKDVGWFTVAINQTDRQILEIEVHNAYPSYAFDCELHWENTGSIPVNFIDYDVVFEGSSCDRSGTDEIIFDCGVFTIVIVNDIGQVDPGEERGRSYIFHVEQPAEQSDCSATGSGTPWQIGGPNPLPANNAAGLDCDPETLVDYSFQIKLCVAQWNEAATYQQCVDSDQHEGPGGAGDEDFDGVYEPDDNCPDDFNPGQEDVDADGVGAACDPDDTDDTVP
jgi:hypothetical protein